MQSQHENQSTTTETATTTTAKAPNANPTIQRLVRMRHLITLPDETPPPSELKRLVRARIAELNSEQPTFDLRDDDQLAEFAANKSALAVLDQHLGELERDFSEIEPTVPPAESLSSLNSLSSEKIADLTETTETIVQPQQHPAETELRRGETELRPTETDPAKTESDSTTRPTQPNPNTDPATSDQDKKFAAKLKQIPEEYRDIAADLYEQLHQRAKFSKLTSDQRRAIYELCEVHEVEDVVEILAEPPPIGINFKVSRPGLYRFVADYKRILFDEKKIEAHKRAEQERLAAEKSFQEASASDEAFRAATERQIRQRLFNAVHNPTSDFHEIRCLLKSLDHLRKPDPA